MAWVIAELRGQRVFARANDSGELAASSGRVEIRYNKDDGRLYRAAARNLAIVDPTPLPDDTCSSAEQAPSAREKAAARRAATPAPFAAAPHEVADGAVIAYTDGACSGNPGPAGLGVVVLRGDQRVERYEYLGEATNNIAELTAVLRAIDEIGDVAAKIYTDSSYTIGVAQKGWKAKANTALVAELKDALVAHGKAQLIHVRGHAGIELNERADELARRAIRERGSGRDVFDA